MAKKSKFPKSYALPDVDKIGDVTPTEKVLLAKLAAINSNQPGVCDYQYTDTENVWFFFFGHQAKRGITDGLIDSVKGVYDAVVDMADTALSSFTGKTNYPQLTCQKDWEKLIKEHFTPEVTRSLFPPAGFTEVITDTFTRASPTLPPKDADQSKLEQWYDSARHLIKNDPLLHFTGMKLRFPLMDTQQVMYMSYFGRRVAPDGFNQGSALVWSYNTLLLADSFRLHYTIGRLSRLYLKFNEYEHAKKTIRNAGIANWKVNQAVTQTSIGHYIYHTYEQTYLFYQAVAEAAFGAQKTSLPGVAGKELDFENQSFTERSRANIALNVHPYERFLSEAVIKIDNFYLFLDELTSYQETYKYGWRTVETLFTNYQYYSGGNQQTVNFKARLVYTNRKYWDYFIRLANSNRRLRFMVHHDDQVRHILITNVDCEYKFQPQKNFIRAPKPAYADFVIKGIVSGAPLPPFRIEDYKDDPSVTSVESYEDKKKRAERLAKWRGDILTNQERLGFHG